MDRVEIVIGQKCTIAVFIEFLYSHNKTKDFPNINPWFLYRKTYFKQSLLIWTGHSKLNKTEVPTFRTYSIFRQKHNIVAWNFWCGFTTRKSLIPEGE